jgi:hypothetical protein
MEPTTSGAEDSKGLERRVFLELASGGGVLIRDAQSAPMSDERRRLRLRPKQLAS